MKSNLINAQDELSNQNEMTDFVTLFARQKKSTPNNTAIIFEDKQLSYEQLDQLSDHFKQAILSAQTKSKNNNKGSQDICIGLCIDKSPEVIAAMIGVLKAGAAFVPLDPEYPIERIAYMVEDADIDTIIAQPNYQDAFSQTLSTHHQIEWINCFQESSNESVISSKNKTDIQIQDNDLAYIMYTSGSTGKPKGVQIEHKALVTYCLADIDVYKVVESDRTLQFSTINFDIAIEEIFPPLLTGGCIVVRPSGRSNQLNELSAIINDYQITAVHIATAYWHEWVDLMKASNDQIPSSLRLIVVTGEKVSTKHYQRWKNLCQLSSQHILWCNTYGPTEATVSASVFIPDDTFNQDNMPIGKPLKRYTARIVDESNNNVAQGETGQLLIGGPALARGYLNRPELNKAVFIEIPTVTNKKIYERMYKTGDLARWLPNGDIEFAGRIDHQIKQGSYRIEPGEIEVAINQHNAVLESLIQVLEVDNKKTLIAYVAHADNNISAYDLSQFLGYELPSYMIPTRYVFLNRFPKTTNGKIDRKALPDASQSIVPRALGFVEPRNDLEKALAKQWEEVLQVPEVGIHDDFFALGGSSLLAVGVVSRLISSMQLELPVRDFFANPTIASMAKHIQQLQGVEQHDSDAEADSKALRARLPIIKPGFFKHGDINLFGVHYQPPNPVQTIKPSNRKHAVLICHPLGHEYPRSFRNLQQLAIQLGRAGFDSLRFDYASTGNSQGKSADLTAEQCIQDIKHAAQYLREQSQCEQLSIIAVRMGAPLAVLAEIEDVENLILWDPISKGESYLQLLEKFHQKILTPMSRFIRFKKPSPLDQLYGHAMSETKRKSLLALNFPHIVKHKAKSQYLLSSTHYIKNEGLNLALFEGYEQLATNDDIYWHDSDYTESAFSSPEFYTSVLKLLEKSDTAFNKEKD